MNELIAVGLPGGKRFVDEIRRAWGDDDAIMPIDHRLSWQDQLSLVERFAASTFIDSKGNRHKMSYGKPVEPGDALVMPTSGTTGLAKAAVLTHDALAASAKLSSDALQVTDTDHWLACLPLSHIGGFSVVARALITGTELTVESHFDPALVAKHASNGATLVSLVTAAMMQIDTSLFKKILLGGGPAPDDRPDNAVVTYGMTETGSGVVYDDFALPSVHLRVDRTNRLWVHSPTLLRAYRNIDESPLDENGWFCTNDEAHLAYDGRLTILGRADFVILTGGEKVWPETLEATINQHPAISECLAYGKPDREWGQVVSVDVVLERGSSLPSLDEMREFVKELLPRRYAPRLVKAVSALPKTSSGKLKRQKPALEH
jgi:o-succinylbenzoate---CoA ligase